MNSTARIPLSPIAISLSLIVLFSISTYNRNDLWRTPLRIWLDAAEKVPSSARIHNNVGMSYVYADNVSAAISEFRKALELNEYYFQAYYNLGRSLVLTGDQEEALYYFERYCAYGPPDVLKQESCERARLLREGGESK